MKMRGVEVVIVDCLFQYRVVAAIWSYTKRKEYLAQ